MNVVSAGPGAARNLSIALVLGAAVVIIGDLYFFVRDRL